MGVKSLWNLLAPVGRPILLETVEGKTMAIDSSIWIYQFQATMRTKDGQVLVNAHVLGFLRRITKLLFYGIKPVFVFDGGAPTLKRATLNERRKKKSGAAVTHAKLAEKLLAAQLRREALNHAEGTKKSASSPKNKKPRGPVVLNEDTVYLEDVDGSVPKTPAHNKKPTEPSPSSSKKKHKFYDHDPYKLPEVDLEVAVAKATRSVAPDPRLATEDELRAFIEDMRPEDFDVTSPAFRELPTEVQYEIVGDLRLKSRQTSYARLQNMLRSAHTPMDFSKKQIQNLRQRNNLTQQLLMTTDSIGNAHISIPVRIASERNKEYVLIKNESEAGGWILGIRDQGTREKPIEIDHDEDVVTDSEKEDSEEDMEEVSLPEPAAHDPDLREHQRQAALSGIEKRRPRIQRSDGKAKTTPLFHLEEDELPTGYVLEDFLEDDDEELAFAIQESLDQTRDPKSSAEIPTAGPSNSKVTPSPQPLLRQQFGVTTSPKSSINRLRQLSSPEDLLSSYPLQTALTFANAGSSRSQLLTSPSFNNDKSSFFGQPSLLSRSSNIVPPSDMQPTVTTDFPPEAELVGSGYNSQSEELEAITIPAAATTSQISVAASVSNSDLEEVVMHASSPKPTSRDDALPAPVSTEDVTDEDEDMEAVAIVEAPEISSTPLKKTPQLEEPVMSRELVESDEGDMEHIEAEPFVKTPPPPDITRDKISSLPNDDSAEMLFMSSRSPSPFEDFTQDPQILQLAPPVSENWDAAEEMDVHAEEGEFANFVSQVKGRDIETVRREIDDEIRVLNDQRKAAMRDSEDITQQMISQIMTMLRLFGIPYITAPMEAEAQCAELVTLGLVDGVITDDSDVFLFGAQRVYKNMFNQSKTVECFLLSDLSRELGLDKDTLIRLAYLLGSDYVEGLPGVGPVMAMELLKEFPGKDGLHKFKDWWLKVQSGKDKEEDNKSKFRKHFKKKFKELYLPTDWPNTAVKDAYYHPTVDSSEEPFKWGLPDLDGLRDFFREELGWGKAKVDELLLPIIQKMNKRGQAAALNKQGNLIDFLDVSAGSGTYAPRKRQAYASKRLQKVVSDFRKQQKNTSSSASSCSKSQSVSSTSTSESEVEMVPDESRKRKRVAAAPKRNSKGKTKASTTNAKEKTSRPRKAAKRPRAKKPEAKSSAEDEDQYPADGAVTIDVPLAAELRPRPKPRPINKSTQETPY